MAANSFNIVDGPLFHRDSLKELAIACSTYGIQPRLTEVAPMFTIIAVREQTQCFFYPSSYD